MKARLEQLAHKKSSNSFICYEIQVPAFEFIWHYHPEYELTYIVKGKGKRLVGDSYENSEEGDLILLGSMLPHTWVSEKVRRQPCVAIVIQFTSDFIHPLQSYREMDSIVKLIARSDTGLTFNLSKNNPIIEQIKRMTTLRDFDVWISLVQVLQSLSILKSKPLASNHFKALRGNKNEQRINKVLQYIQRDFKETISLRQAATLIHLSESAFCKFFKRVTGKTFSNYVNEIRIAHSCNLLIETDKSISLIAQGSGFESLTYFNRVFLKKKRIAPSKFREIGQKE